MDYQNILNSIRKKNELFRKYKKTHSKFCCYRYKYYRNTIHTLITKCKRNHLKKLFQDNCTKKSVVKNKCNATKHKETLWRNISFYDEKIITNQETMASKFNNCFANVAINLLKDIGESNNKFQNFLKNPNEKYLIYLIK